MSPYSPLGKDLYHAPLWTLMILHQNSNYQCSQGVRWNVANWSKCSKVHYIYKAKISCQKTICFPLLFLNNVTVYSWSDNLEKVQQHFAINLYESTEIIPLYSICSHCNFTFLTTKILLFKFEHLKDLLVIEWWWQWQYPWEARPIYNTMVSKASYKHKARFTLTLNNIAKPSGCLSSLT